MEEKILVKSKRYSVKKLFIALLVLGIIFFVIGSLIVISDFDSRYKNHKHWSGCYKYMYRDDVYKDYLNDVYKDREHGELQEYKMDCCTVTYDSAAEYALSSFWEYTISVQYTFWFTIFPLVASALIGGIIYIWSRRYELVVTDKRIYGKIAWGKRIDLPLDSISATSTIRLLKGISVSTSSGRIKFLIIKNSNEIYTTISNLLIERQQTNDKFSASSQYDGADQIKKFKELLDMGIITQEEFDAKKKELLGL